MATIKEIAKACDVSIATVSNVLNDKPGASETTRKRVMKAIEELNYTPNYVAKNLKEKITRTIGVIAEDMAIFSIPDIIDGITEHCEEENYHILLMNLRLNKKYNDTYYNLTDYFGSVLRALRELIAKQVDGIIYVGAHERIIKCLPEYLPIPTVMAYGYTGSDHIPSVVVDDVHGAYEICSHIIKKGHKIIGVIAGKSDSIHMQDRLIGYQQALYDAKLLYNPELVIIGDWTSPSGYQYTDRLLEKGVTAIFCMNDLMAGGVYDRLDERGLTVGKDIAVAGFDNRQLSSYYHPPLTTVELPLHDIGYRSSEIIINMLKYKNIIIQPVHQIKCELLIRYSINEL